MKIEPCPVCGAEIEYYNDHDGMLGCVSCDYGLVYLDEQSITMHNHLSRIVRAAERLIRTREALVEAFAQMDMEYPHFSVSQKADRLTRDVDDANRELTKAVNGKGGAE